MGRPRDRPCGDRTFLVGDCAAAALHPVADRHAARDLVRSHSLHRRRHSDHSRDPGGRGRACAGLPLARLRLTSGNRLSGSEQLMLASARALVGGPKNLLLDEPPEGLAPSVVENLFAALLAIRDNAGVTMILTEQKVDLALLLPRMPLCSNADALRSAARQPSCGRTKRCNTGCWRSANCNGRRLAERSDHPYPDPNVEKGRRRCHCGNSSTGFIAAPEVA